MSTVSVAEAKAQFAQLVHEAEAGRPVRITRRGRPVAVLISEAEFARLGRQAPSWLTVVAELRAEAEAGGLQLFSDCELAGLRDQSERRTPAFE